MSQERWGSVDEVATHLGVTRETICRWIERKSLPTHGVGRMWRHGLTEIDEWVRSGGDVPDSGWGTGLGDD